MNVEAYFKESGLHYTNISRYDIELLRNFYENHCRGLRLKKKFVFNPKQGMVSAEIYSQKFFKKEYLIKFNSNKEIILIDTNYQDENLKRFNVFKKWCAFVSKRKERGY